MHTHYSHRKPGAETPGRGLHPRLCCSAGRLVPWASGNLRPVAGPWIYVSSYLDFERMETAGGGGAGPASRAPQTPPPEPVAWKSMGTRASGSARIQSYKRVGASHPQWGPEVAGTEKAWPPGPSQAEEGYMGHGQIETEFSADRHRPRSALGFSRVSLLAIVSVHRSQLPSVQVALAPSVPQSRSEHTGSISSSSNPHQEEDPNFISGLPWGLCDPWAVGKEDAGGRGNKMGSNRASLTDVTSSIQT
ncbi:hypothetical protein P7K49_009005 [Saguinus oedipus]|uniref:Uncharacterized protein n=1 Tax=Saguinus oedipus TaxID=9490 RepID=A0ABQ9VZD9_SAGOE|nr:hypothetical protein P7K49_009005 [Saguinus oedipus]